MRAPIGSFENACPAIDRLDLLTEPVAAAVTEGSGGVPAAQLIHVDTDPAIADTAVFVEHHGAEMLDRSANCVQELRNLSRALGTGPEPAPRPDGTAVGGSRSRQRR